MPGYSKFGKKTFAMSNFSIVQCEKRGSFMFAISPYRYPECPPGTYGSACKRSCSQTCGGDNSCDSRDGTCRQGCDPGYTGKTCQSSKERMFIIGSATRYTRGSCQLSEERPFIIGSAT